VETVPKRQFQRRTGLKMASRGGFGLARFFALLTVLVALSGLVGTTSALAAPGEMGEARRASSSPDEPSLVVGPEGEVLLTDEETEPVGPGIEHTAFDRLDSRGWIRGDLLTVDLGKRGVSTDLLFPGKVAAAEPLSDSAEREGAVAGVNGDFFDIGNTKAPLGAQTKDGKLLKGQFPGWTNAVGVGRDRIGRLAQVALEGTVALPGGERKLDAFNQPNIPQNGVALYTPLWGSGDRKSAVANAARVREVVLRDGRVESVAESVGENTIPEGASVLVGREAGADALAGLEPGDPVSVSYRPKTDSASPLRFSVGGNIVLLRDGTLPALDDVASEPRTAAGFSADGKTMYLATIDGRQRDSRGMTMRELGELMLGFGADDALNLDGGGSSTLLAREPGEEDPDVENSPSDGSERPVPNGVGIFVAEGSGRLEGFDVEPVGEDENATRVFPGLTRTFEAKGYDETYAPVSTRGTRWNVRPGSVGRFDRDGVFRARKTGEAVAEARLRGERGTSELRVLGELSRVETGPERLGLVEGGEGEFTVTGYDADGYAAPIEPRDVKLEYDGSVVAISPTEGGAFRVVPKISDGSTLVTLRVLGKETYLPITVGLKTEAVSGFEEPGAWTFSKFPAAVGGSMDFVPGRNGQALRLSYDFSTTTATRAAYANANPLLNLPGEPRRIGMWVNGDGNGAWLRTVVRDASGTNYTLTLAPEVDWSGWRYVEAVVPDGVQYPLQLSRIYPVETNRADQYTGQLLFDDLSVSLTPSVEVPEKPVVRDPVIVQNGSLDEGRWKFAVISDTQFVGKAPDSDLVRTTRESLRKILASDPEFLVIAGDFVDTGYPEDFELAERILREEIGDRIPVYYIPGNHELIGPGNLDNFRARFGETRYTFDQNGTRFILLNSSTGSLRTSDFQQLVEMKASLDDAARDRTVKNVVVVAHHPTRDPLPTQNSQLSDRKEAALVEEWLTEFREESGGKGAFYLASHAQSVNVQRVEGVPYMVMPPNGKAPYGPAGNGGLNGWALFGIDPKPAKDPGDSGGEWLRAEVRPLLESAEISAPDSLAAGETVEASATGTQPGGRQIPLRYPATVAWSGSENLFVGSGQEAERAERSRRYAAVFDPETGELRALRGGEEVTLRVESNGVGAEKRVRLTGVGALPEAA
jgi:hypothetical protein